MPRFSSILLASIAIASTAFSSSPFAASLTTDPGELIQSVAADITTTVKPRSGSEREAAMRQVLRSEFDLVHLASVTIGPHWDNASEPQKARLLTAFEITEAKAYVDRLGNFLSVTVSGVSAKGPGVWAVDSRLNFLYDQSVRVEWEVRQTDKDLRISDVKVGGVSLYLTKRASFQSYIQAHGGQVEPLVQVLEARAAR